MGFFKKAFATNSEAKQSQSSSTQGSFSAPGSPPRPPRSSALSETYKRYQQAFERAKEEEFRKLDILAEKVSRQHRTGSVIIKLDNAIQHSTKATDVVHEDDAPLAMPKELAEVLRSPLLRNAFRAYLKRKYAGESLTFFETIEMFKRVPQEEWRCQMAEGMLERFVLENAEFAVNISFADRSELLARKRTRFWPKDSFDAVQREMYDLMSSNYFSSFCRTYWPGGVLLAVPGGPFSYENLMNERDIGSTSSIDEFGSNSTAASDKKIDI